MAGVFYAVKSCELSEWFSNRDLNRYEKLPEESPGLTGTLQFPAIGVL